MPLNNIVDKKSICYILLMMANFFFIISIILFTIYLVCLLFSGKLLIFAILKYFSWILLAIMLKIVIRKIQNYNKIERKDYLLLYSILSINLFFSIKYPFSIILCISISITFIYSYLN